MPESSAQTVYALNEYLKKCQATAYAEPQSQLHTALAATAWSRIADLFSSHPVGRVLDVGCGCGFCFDMFIKGGYNPIGLTTVSHEFEEVESRYPGSCIMMDMHEVGRFDEYFQGAWCRHIAEHSPAPGFFISQVYRSLKPGGWMYLEVPAPGTECKHEENPNHYSILGAEMWQQLITRAGFEMLDHFKFNFTTKAGEDQYFCWISKRPNPHA